MVTAGADVGGTKVSAALVDEEGRIRRKIFEPTDAQAGTKSIVEALERLLDQAAPDERPAAIGVAAAGFVEYPSGRILFAPNLTYGQLDVGRVIQDRFGLDVVVENDANAAAWAEQQYGAARGNDEVLMLTIGTGIGGGLISDGKLFRGHRGFAAEFGHITLVEGGPQCACGERGCLEALASGHAIARMAREEILSAPASLLFELTDGVPDRITGALVSDAAYAGDEFAPRSSSVRAGGSG
jgi:glucokinase